MVPVKLLYQRGSFILVPPRDLSPLQGPAVLLRTTHAEVPAVATAERKEVSGLFHNTCLKCNRFGNNKMSKTYKWRGLKSTAFGENQKVQLNFERISENKYKSRVTSRQEDPPYSGIFLPLGKYPDVG